MILMIQREHFAHQNCELIRCHTLNKIRPFICFGSNDSHVWRRHAITTKKKKDALPLLVLADELIWLFVFIYYTLLNLCGWFIIVMNGQSACCEFFMSVFAFASWFVLVVHIHLICTNGVNSTVIRLGHSIFLSRSFHFLFILYFFI